MSIKGQALFSLVLSPTPHTQRDTHYLLPCSTEGFSLCPRAAVSFQTLKPIPFYRSFTAFIPHQAASAETFWLGVSNGKALRRQCAIRHLFYQTPNPFIMFTHPDVLCNLAGISLFIKVGAQPLSIKSKSIHNLHHLLS